MTDQIDDDAENAAAQEDPFGFEAASSAGEKADPAPVDLTHGEPAADPSAANLPGGPRPVGGSYGQEAYGRAAQRSKLRSEQYTPEDGPLTPPDPPIETGSLES